MKQANFIKYNCDNCGNEWETSESGVSETCPECKSRLIHSKYY